MSEGVIEMGIAEPNGSLVLRVAQRSDSDAVARVAQRDTRRPPEGEVMLAELDGEPVAAIEVVTGRAVADPFRPTAGVVRLLREWRLRHRERA